MQFIGEFTQQCYKVLFYDGFKQSCGISLIIQLLEYLTPLNFE